MLIVAHSEAASPVECDSCGIPCTWLLIVTRDALSGGSGAIAVVLCVSCREKLLRYIDPSDTRPIDERHAQLGLCDFCGKIHPPTDNRENGGNSLNNSGGQNGGQS